METLFYFGFYYSSSSSSSSFILPSPLHSLLFVFSSSRADHAHPPTGPRRIFSPIPVFLVFFSFSLDIQTNTGHSNTNTQAHTHKLTNTLADRLTHSFSVRTLGRLEIKYTCCRADSESITAERCLLMRTHTHMRICSSHTLTHTHTNTHSN